MGTNSTNTLKLFSCNWETIRPNGNCMGFQTPMGAPIFRKTFPLKIGSKTNITTDKNATAVDIKMKVLQNKTHHRLCPCSCCGRATAAVVRFCHKHLRENKLITDMGETINRNTITIL